MFSKIISRLSYLYKTCFEIFGLYPKPVIASEDVMSILEEGFVILPSLTNADIKLLEKCKDAHFTPQVNGNQGQLKGRVFANGLICNEIAPLLTKPIDIVRNIYGGQEPNIELTYFQESYPQESLNSIP
jgi:hypothetical protein